MPNTSDPAFWPLASFALAVIATNLAWLVRRWRVARGPVLPALAWLAVALFSLWPPVLAWRAGALSAYYLGLTETDWLDALGTAGLLALAIIGLALLGWLVYRRRVREDAARLASDPQGTTGPGNRAGPAGRDWPRSLAPFSAILDQWHWAFYWAAAIGWLAAGTIPLPTWVGERSPWLAGLGAALLAGMQEQPFYWGCWLGTLLAGVEWLASPFTRSALRTPGRLERQARAAALCVATAALFSLTRNFWLCLLCSLVVETLVAGWFPALEAETGVQ